MTMRLCLKMKSKGNTFSEKKYINFSLTEKERLDMQYRKKVLEYAKEHDAAGEIMKVDR